MTSAPISASIMLQIGPERMRDKSTTKRSSSGRMARNHNRDSRAEFLWKFCAFSVPLTVFLDADKASWLEISTDSSTKGC